MTSLHEEPVRTAHDEASERPVRDEPSTGRHRRRWLVAVIGVAALVMTGGVWWLLDSTVPKSDYDEVVAELDATEDALARAEDALSEQESSSASLAAQVSDLRVRVRQAGQAAMLLAYFTGLERPNTPLAPRWDRDWAGVVSRDVAVERIGDPELTDLYWEYLDGGVGDPDPAVAANEFIVRLVELTIEPLVEGRR